MFEASAPTAACTVTGKPAACACSTSSRSSSIENCGENMRRENRTFVQAAPHTDGDSGLMDVPTKLEEQIRAGSRRRRLLIAPVAVVAIVGLLLANAVAVGQQAAEATGDSTLPLGGGNIYVRQDGPRDGPHVVLIHGLAGSTRWWDSLIPLLARSHRVIRIDLLGHGQSAKPAGRGYEIHRQ
jgi:alpha/beta hydrolase fold